MGVIRFGYHVDCFLRLRNGLIIGVMLCSYMFLKQSHRCFAENTEENERINCVHITLSNNELVSKIHKEHLKL